MASLENDTIKGMLQARLNTCSTKSIASVAGQRVNAQKTVKPLAPSVLA